MEEHICKYCSKNFNSKFEKSIFCSHECYWKYKKGTKLSEETIRKMREFRKGKKLSIETKQKISDAIKKWHLTQDFTNEKNPCWKGDKVGMTALHDWIKKYKPKSLECEKCSINNQKLEAANISGQYKRDINDFMWLCRKCHCKYDNISEKIKMIQKIKKMKNL